MNLSNFTVGCDPEIFVKKKGKAFSAHGLVEGTKEKPQKTNRGAVQVDGLALEFNTDPVALSDFTGFNLNIVKTVGDLKALVAAEGVSFNISPTQEFDKDLLESQPKEALELGCDPDFNAYTMQENPSPKEKATTFRTAAGHIHLGWGADIPVDNEDHFKICADFVKTLDATVGLFMTIIDREPLRRELYGKAGAFRPKPYGVEYRTPSNVWIRNKNYRKLVFVLLQQAVKIQSSPRGISNYIPEYSPEKIETIINTGSFQEAETMLYSIIPWECRDSFSKMVEKMKENS